MSSLCRKSLFPRSWCHPHLWWGGLGGGRAWGAQERIWPSPRGGCKRATKWARFFSHPVSHCLLQSQRRGGRRGGLPNNVFGVWGKGNPPAVGFDDGGHRGLLGVHPTLDEPVVLHDAAEMGEGDRSLGVKMKGVGGFMPGFPRWGLRHFLGPLEALDMSPRPLEVGRS